MKTITKIEFKSDQGDNIAHVGYGDKLRFYEIGKNGVSEIVEFQPRKSGDMWSYLISFENGTRQRVFQPNRVWESVVSTLDV